MVAPVEGPFYKTFPGYITQNSAQVQVYERISTGYTQKRPYNLVLPYDLWNAWNIESTDTRYPGQVASEIGGRTPFPRMEDYPTEKARAYDKAYAELKDAINNTVESGMGITLSQRREAMGMISSRALQIMRFVIRLRRLDFVGAGRVLGLDPKVNRRLGRTLSKRGLKTVAGTFLEYHFGWEPLIKDIGGAINVLQGGIPPPVVRGRGSEKIKSSSTTHIGTPPDDVFETRRTEAKVTCKISTLVRVSNPNLWLANQLGFINPAAVAWDLVPFSFVVDWFVNVNEFLNSYTDMWGLSFEMPCTSFSIRGTSSIHIVAHGSYGYTCKLSGGSFELHRSPGIGAGPSLKVRNIRGISPTRGITAISLLIQKLRN